MRSALAALAASARMTTLVANRQTAVMTAKVRAALISWADASVLRRSVDAEAHSARDEWRRHCLRFRFQLWCAKAAKARLMKQRRDRSAQTALRRDLLTAFFALDQPVPRKERIPPS